MPDKEEERKNNIVELRAIVDRVKKGGTDPNDLAEAIRINELLGVDFSNVVDLIKKNIDANNELAAKTSPLSPEDLANKPYAAVEAANKFLKLEGVQKTLATNNKILKGDPTTEEERLVAINTAATTRKQREEIDIGMNARLETIKREINANPSALHKHKDEIDTIFSKRDGIDQLTALDKAAEKVGSSRAEAAKMERELQAAFEENIIAIKHKRNSEYHVLTGVDRAAAREEERQQQRTMGKKRKDAGINTVESTLKKTSKIETIDSSAPKSPDATPGSDKKGKKTERQ